MLVALADGADRNRVLQLLREAATEITNQNGKPADYVRWIHDRGQTLRGQISSTDIDQLLYTGAYYRLMDWLVRSAFEGGSQARQLLSTEITDRQVALTDAADTLDAHLRAWTPPPSTVLAVVDTSVFLPHPTWRSNDDPTEVIASIPWADELHLAFEDILLAVPEVVIRELDRLKESSGSRRHRTQVTLAVIDRLLRDPNATVPIRARDHESSVPRGGISLKVFYDDPAHVPLAEADAEIIDRAVALKRLAGAKVRMLTMDTGMGLNARRAGLAVTKPLRPIDPPPPRGDSTRARRRAKDAGQLGPGDGQSDRVEPSV